MKRINNIYDEILDLKKIQNMYDKRIRINTKNKKKLEKFEYNYVSNVIFIKNVLKNRNYVIGKYNIFLIKEPKIRLIMSQNIIDKIINHMVSEYLLNQYLEKKLIDTNIATRKNKGTYYGIKLLKKYINELKNDEFYILKFDISKYFYNIDHDILKQLLLKNIKDKDVLKLVFDIIDSTDCSYVNKEITFLKKNEIKKNFSDKNIIKEIEKIPIYEKGKGLPIGNMSSQFLAIFYLNELDHFIKEKLNIKYYIRYMDDGILLFKDKDYLKFCLNEIENILDKYKLKLNKDKTKIISSKQGFEFLGLRYIIKNNKLIIKIKNQTKRRFKRKMKKLSKLVEEKKMTKKEFKQIKDSYIGHLSLGNSKNLIKKTLKKEEKDIGCVKVEIINNEIVYK